MNDLSDNIINDLKKKAKEASSNAYSPYSKFKVGAALLTENGKIFTGCNVENASYGLTICAERNAVFQMVAKGELEIIVLIIYTSTKEPTASCGACRQVINEFAPHVRIISVCDGLGKIDLQLSELLPNSFGPKNLDL